MSAAYPLSADLSFDEMCRRLRTVEPSIGCIRARHEPDPNASLHILVKDNISVEGFTTPAGSLALKDLVLPEAPCVTKLREAGIDIFGKTHMTELAGFVTTSVLSRGYSQLGGFGINPYGDFPTYGSSSGSAIAVAAGLCDAALGTETKGSLIMPGLANGVWAFKPSVGMITRRNVVPLSSHFDTVGVLARHPTDLARVFEAMVGFDAVDPVTELSRTLNDPTEEVTSLRIGLLQVLGTAGLSPVQAEALKRIKEQSIVVVELSVPKIDFDYKLITSQDIRCGMDRMLGRYAKGSTPASFEELVRFYRDRPETHPYGMERLDDALAMEPMSDDELETVATENITRANAVINALCEEYGVNFLMAPNFIDWWSIAGAPSAAMPVGLEVDGRPVGLMVGARRGEDRRMLRLLESVESVLSGFGAISGANR